MKMILNKNTIERVGLTKQDTLVLKGIAICFMLFLHLFYHKKGAYLCANFLFLKGVPISYLFSYFTHICVPIYLFLSGYGLYISFEERKKQKVGNRIISLWLNYLIIFAVFITLGSVLLPNKYPGSYIELLLNILTYSYSYNYAWWFLFPYFVLVLISVPLFRVLKKHKSWIIFLVLIIIGSLTHITINIYQSYLLSHTLIYKPILVIGCLFTFAIGALFAKENIIAKVRNYLSPYLSVGIIFLLILIKMFFPNNFLNPYVAVAFILCFSIIKRNKIIDNILALLGKHSTNIWLLHTFFCYYLFKDFIYSFKYPLLIFIVLLLVSLVSSYVVNFVYKLLNMKLMKLFE